MTVLFVNWEGPNTRYLESLFLPLLTGALRGGDQLRVLHFGWDQAHREDEAKRLAAKAGVDLRFVSVWRRPLGPATLASVGRGALAVASEVRRHRVDVVMPRSNLCAGMALGARRLAPPAGLLYDADGLMADERADFGGWSRDGKAYRLLRAFEDRAVAQADAVVTRTEWAVGVLAERAGRDLGGRAFVVSNGRDPNVFAPGMESDRSRTRQELGVALAAPLLVYAGSMGPQYRVGDMIALFSAVCRRRPDARFLLLTGEPDLARPLVEASGVGGAAIVRRVPPLEVPRYLAAADVGLALRTPFFSQRAVAPVKIAEYLLCGVPTVASAGIGEGVAVEGVGFLVAGGRGDWMELAADWIISDVISKREAYRGRARARGVERFSLDRSTSEYRRAFDAVRPAHSN
ncbi:glycosyltransferase [Rubrivirga sp. S365]|uniref:Glycosyltransferase n=1 Tax=Rubrivirga litoralis TaxID=3075598 RepID=A0ABU3BR97_9BACT|nr:MULTISPECIES: glycosyltransferase [unclassified Rubrivirga]MDT0631811.1 glycosyltransferase [Rubrivirga sp. F394]MDT7856497.1 glycosyltransferase [Rubrivirga sp. S365]